ncbi:DUF937 domain-containing protein [Methylocystis sp. IM2]|uniref:DUF937 domain-containing protein n=1 Tax=Methylocystis sp. IM2 TaxID=3136563 RepID=UPI0030F87D7A
MSDLETLLSSAQGGQLVANLADRFGLTEEQIESAIRALSPALAMGLDRAAEEPEVFEKTVGALAGASRYSFFDEPEAAHSQDAVDLGRDLLNEMFGSQAATGQVLQAAARESGVRADILGQILPILVSVLLSGLTKSINDKGLGGLLGQLASSGALGRILEQLLGGGGAPRPAPEPAPRGNSGGGLGGLLGSVLGALLGRRPAPLRGRSRPAGRPARRRRRVRRPSAGARSGRGPGGDRRDQEDAPDRAENQSAGRPERRLRSRGHPGANPREAMKTAGRRAHGPARPWSALEIGRDRAKIIDRQFRADRLGSRHDHDRNDEGDDGVFGRREASVFRKNAAKPFLQ